MKRLLIFHSLRGTLKRVNEYYDFLTQKLGRLNFGHFGEILEVQ